MDKRKRCAALGGIFSLEEKDFIYWYYGFRTEEKLSLDQIANHMNMSRTKVTKIRNKVEDELTDNPNLKKYFKDFL
jgi:DNA-directed RNA polymerase sigma subunit (sigma70/sigma32)